MISTSSISSQRIVCKIENQTSCLKFPEQTITESIFAKFARHFDRHIFRNNFGYDKNFGGKTLLTTHSWTIQGKRSFWMQNGIDWFLFVSVHHIFWQLRSQCSQVFTLKTVLTLGFWFNFSKAMHTFVYCIFEKKFESLRTFTRNGVFELSIGDTQNWNHVWSKIR